MQATVREIQHQVRIDLTDAPKLTNIVGRTRQPHGLRLSYGLRVDITRVDITVEWEDAAELWPPAADMPDWLRRIIDAHRPVDVDEPNSHRPTGMGGWPVYLPECPGCGRPMKSERLADSEHHPKCPTFDPHH